MRRQLLGALALCTVVVMAGYAVVAQAGFRFEQEIRAHLIRMIHREPAACVDLIEQSQSLEGLRQALVERVRTEYRSMKIIEAARALRELDLSEDMTLRELREAAEAAGMEKDEG